MIRRIVTAWVFMLGTMVVLTGPNVLVANMAGHMTGGDSAGVSGHYVMAELSEDQMRRAIGGQGCFGFGPSCCEIIESVISASTWLSGFNMGFFPLLHISSSSYAAFCT